jgi:hypothetical protein
MSRWKYRTATVTVGENSQDVRQLTAGERKALTDVGAKIKAAVMLNADVPLLIASFGCINPAVSIDEAHQMPPDLLDAVCSKIFELTNIANPGEEKKTADS